MDPDRVLSYWVDHANISFISSITGPARLAMIDLTVKNDWVWKCLYCERHGGSYFYWIKSESKMDAKNYAIQHLIEKHKFVYEEKYLCMI